MPCPHNEITIVQRSQRQSAVAAAAYGTLTGACHFLFENDRRFSYFQEDLVECI